MYKHVGENRELHELEPILANIRPKLKEISILNLLPREYGMNDKKTISCYCTCNAPFFIYLYLQAVTC
jgi:hypothetical protein